jgi:hypothetical protein
MKRRGHQLKYLSLGKLSLSANFILAAKKTVKIY